MKKEKNKIGQNVSSGAEKVEEIIRKERPQNLAATQSATSTGMNTPASQNTAAYEPIGGEGLTPQQREAQAARRRVQAAVAEKQKKDAEEAYRRMQMEKARKASGAWRQSYKDALEREKKKQREREKGDSPKRAPGFGGWLAAVVALGAATLTLITVVAVGATAMSKERKAAYAAARGTLYEFVSVVEDMEECLDEARIVNSPALKSQLLTGAVVQARMAEMDLEKMPFAAEADRHLTTYLNQTAHACEGMLAKLRAGENLSGTDEKMLEGLHEVSEKVTDRLGDLMEEMEDKDMAALFMGKDCCIGKAMKEIEGITTPQISDERRIPPRSKESPSMQGKGESTLTSSQAREMCLRYFADYAVQDVVYDGETVAKKMCTYNFTMQDKEGVRLFAQIDEKDGALVTFDYYAPCTEKRIDEETCLKKAREFLDKLGYQDMTAIAISTEGTTVDIRFAKQVDDVLYYGKEVLVKVCMERGKVVGLNAEQYIENADMVASFEQKVSMQQAMDGLDEKLTVESTRAVVFPYRGKTYSAYEFFCSYDGEFYHLYVDAESGNQLFIKKA